MLKVTLFFEKETSQRIVADWRLTYKIYLEKLETYHRKISLSFFSISSTKKVEWNKVKLTLAFFPDEILSRTNQISSIFG